MVALATGIIWCFKGRQPGEIAQRPGMLIKSEPIQLDFPPMHFTETAGWSLSRLASFHIHGRVLGVKRYRDDRSILSPVDVILGWGPMSDTAVLSKLSISQGSRMSYYEFDGNPPISENEIVTHSANIHIIPADVEVARFFDKLRVGELVNLRGNLVTAANGAEVWRSSLVRNDMGPNAGELLYTTQAQVFSGNQDLAAEEISEGLAEARTSLESWYELLEVRRRSLDIRDQKAVHAFNQEAKRYMELAHPEKRAPSPALPVVSRPAITPR